MPNKTSNYQLNQWEPEDNFLRTDFNEDNAKIEEALNQKCEVIFGSYTGDDQWERTIYLGYTPKAVLVAMHGGLNQNYLDSYCTAQLALPGSPADCLAVVEGGFTVQNKLNSTEYYYGPYNYIVFK